MTEQDKLYIESHRLWVKATVRNIRDFKEEVSNCNKKIDSLKEEIKLNIDMHKNAKDYLASGQKSFGLWCAENNIDPETVLQDD